MTDDHSLDLPYEPVPPGQVLPIGDAAVACGVIAMAAHLPVAGYERPAIVFRFVLADGQFANPMVLVLDDDQADKLGPLIGEAATGAVARARELNADGRLVATCGRCGLAAVVQIIGGQRRCPGCGHTEPARRDNDAA